MNALTSEWKKCPVDTSGLDLSANKLKEHRGKMQVGNREPFPGGETLQDAMQRLDYQKAKAHLAELPG